MVNRLALQNMLEELLGSKNVYFQPPSSEVLAKRGFPAIQYSIDDMYIRHADNYNYNRKDRYQLLLIDKQPNPEMFEKLADLKMCAFDRSYNTDNLRYDVFTLYF